jgi:hypothetical protein
MEKWWRGRYWIFDGFHRSDTGYTFPKRLISVSLSDSIQNLVRQDGMHPTDAIHNLGDVQVDQ